MITINLGTERDRKLLAAIGKGCGMKNLPADVGYSRDGADKRLRALIRRHGLSCRAELFYWVGRQGLLDEYLGVSSPLRSGDQSL